MKNKLNNLSAGKIVEIREKLLKRQAKGESVYRFESGDPHFNISDTTKISIISSLFNNKTHYIPNLGIPELRKEVVNKLNKQNINANIENIAITNGAMNGLFVLFQCLIDENSTKREIILPDPE
jgi:aspartate aminotransferase